MCTAIGQENIVKTAIKLGARGYIIKPFQAPKVIEEIRKVVGDLVGDSMIRTLIVDDSAFMRMAIRSILPAART